MYIHNYLTHSNQNNIENLDISKSFFFNLSYVSAYFPRFLTVEMSICVLACMFSFSRGQSLRVHMYTLYIESHFNSSTCVHDYFDGMAKLQTYQHYFIHPPSTHIDLIAKYAKWTILKYYLFITQKINVFQIWKTAKNPSVRFFSYQILVSGYLILIIKLLWDSGQIISRSSTCQNEARCRRRINSFDFNFRYEFL